MATILAAAGGGNWSSGGSWVGGNVPTAADDVQFTSASGNVTIDTAAVCRSLDCSGGGSSNYTGTLTHAAAVTLTIGDSTAGLSNIALKLVAGMTYTLGDAVTSAINFVSTSATVQTLNTGGKTLGALVFNATSGGSWKLADGLNTGISTSVTLTKGSLDFNGQTCSIGSFSCSNSNTRSVTLGAASITCNQGFGGAWSFSIATGLTFSAGTSTVTLSGNSAQLYPGGQTFNNVIFTGAGNPFIGNANISTFANLTRTGTSAKTDTFGINANHTVTGTLTISGNSATNRMLFQGYNGNTPSAGSQRTITVNGSVVATNCDFQDISGAGTASWNLASASGGSGDCGGNSGITFTSSATQTHVTGAAGSWSDSTKWTSRVPLPQDDVVIGTGVTGSFVGDMPRIGRSVDFSSFTGTYSLSVAPSVYGSLTLGSGMTVGAGTSMVFCGRGTHTITSNGKAFSNAINVNCAGGSYTLQDAFSSTGNVFSLISGTFNTNGMAVTTPVVTSGGTVTRALILGSTVWTLTSTSATSIVNITASGLTLSASSSTFVVGAASTNTRTFAGGGMAYGALTYTVAGSTGELDITGANTFTDINFSDSTNARTLSFPASTTTTITGNFNVQGTSGKLMSIISSTSGTAATISKVSGVVACNYLSVKDSAATGGASWFAGANSTNVSNNTGWSFTNGVIIAAAGGGNWTSAATWVGGVVPTIADDVMFNSSSGNVTIDAAASCRSIDCTGGGSSNYTGTLTHAASVTINIGDATAGLGSSALKFSPSMVYTAPSPSTSTINLISTSATVQTVTTAGKSLANTLFNAPSNGSWKLADSLTATNATVTLGKGTLDTNNQTMSVGTFNTSNTNVRTLKLGSSSITITNNSNAWNLTNATNLTFSPDTATITLSNNATFQGGGLTYYALVLNGLSPTIVGTNTFTNLTKNGQAFKTDSLILASNQTITGTLTLAGNSAINRLLILTSTPGTGMTLTAAAISVANVDFQDITGAGTASWNLSAITGLSGDCGGNSGITFTTAATQTHTATAGGNWSDATKWTSRVPLPQDDVVVNASTTGTLGGDMPRSGKSISFTGFAGTFNFSGSTTLYGSLTFVSTMTVTGNQSMTLAGRSNYTLTMAGKSVLGTLVISAPGGTYTLQDNFQTSSNFMLNYGSFDANGRNVTASFVNLATTTATRSLTMGAGTWNVTGTGAGSIWNASPSTGLTLSAALSTIVFPSTSNSHTFAGGSLTYGTFSYIASGSTGSLLISGSNTFTNINFYDASNPRTLTFTAGTTNTVTGNFNVQGTAGNLITIASSTPGSQATLSKASGVVSADYLSLQDSAATGGAGWYAGAHSTNVSNVSGWNFATAPAPAASFMPFFN